MNIKIVLFIIIINTLNGMENNKEMPSDLTEKENNSIQNEKHDHLTIKDMENPKEAAKKLAKHYESLLDIKIDIERVNSQFQLMINENKIIDAERQLALLERIASIEATSALVVSTDKKVETNKRSCVIS